MRKVKMYSGDATDRGLLEKLLRDLVAATNEAREAFIDVDARLAEVEEKKCRCADSEPGLSDKQLMEMEC